MAAVGLLGGGHCAGMCGPLALSLNLGRPPGFWYRLNAARVLGYTLLGTTAGALGAQAAHWGGVMHLGLALYVAAQLLLIGMGLSLAGLPSYIRRIEAAGGRIWKGLSPLFGRELRRDAWFAALSGGLLWALLPCGLIYSALATALAGGTATRGALTMLAFGMGTLPNLLLMGRFASELRQWLSKRWLRRMLGALVVAMGVFGLLRAAALM
jgi:sulfite exporter TauE/SafE